jgi:hypothetical protein
VRIRKIASVFALLAATAGDGMAQGAVRVFPGTRVRVSLRATTTHLTRDRIIGSLVSVQSDTLVVSEHAGRADLVLPTEAIASLEVSRGRKSAAGKGAVIGLVSGAAGGVATGLIACGGGNCAESGLGDVTALLSAALGLGGGLTGAGIGALVGGRIHSDRWEKVPVRDLRVGLGPSGSGASLRVSLAFH